MVFKVAMSEDLFNKKIIRIKELNALGLERPPKFIICGTASGLVALLANQDIPQAPLRKLLLMSVLLLCIMNSIV